MRWALIGVLLLERLRHPETRRGIPVGAGAGGSDVGWSDGKRTWE
jgi:hypothetical protein